MKELILHIQPTDKLGYLITDENGNLLATKTSQKKVMLFFGTILSQFKDIKAGYTLIGQIDDN